MRSRRSAVLWGLLATVAPGAALAQARWESFDVSRAMIRDSTVYQPFLVTETIPLRQALDDETVRNETLVAILDRNGWQLALLIPQLLYHHAAQGRRNGEPWLVSF